MSYQVVDGVWVAGEVCVVEAELAPVEHVEAAVAAAGHQLGVVVHQPQAVHLPLVHLRLRVRPLPADVEALDRAWRVDRNITSTAELSKQNK